MAWLCVLHLTGRVQRSLCDTFPLRHHVNNSVFVSACAGKPSATMFIMQKKINQHSSLMDWMNKPTGGRNVCFLTSSSNPTNYVFAIILPCWISAGYIIICDACADICNLLHNSWSTNTHVKIKSCPQTKWAATVARLTVVTGSVCVYVCVGVRRWVAVHNHLL